MEDVNTGQRLSFSEIRSSLLEFISGKKFAKIWRIERDRISAKKLEAARIHFSSDVFLAVLVLTPRPNYNVKKAIGLDWQNNTCITLFCTFLCRHCTTRTWKRLLLRFIDDVNKRRRIFLSLSKLENGPQETIFREIRLHLTFSAHWNKRVKVWKNANSF